MQKTVLTIPLLLLILLMTGILLPGTAFATEEILLKVDPRLDARGQGFDLAGFSAIRTDRAKQALVLRIPAAPRKTETIITHNMEMFI